MITSNDNVVRVELMANEVIAVFPKDQVIELRDPTQPIGHRAMDGVSSMNFDDAAKQDMGAGLLQLSSS